MHRSIRYFPKILSTHSFNVFGSSLNNCLARVGGWKSTRIVRSHSTESNSELNVDYGDYSIILPPENAAVGVADHKISEVPVEIARPHYARHRPETPIDGLDSLESRRKAKTSRLVLGTEEERRMRRACKLAKETLAFAGSLIKVGATTEHIDTTVHQFIISRGAYPSPLRYQGFPKSICTSLFDLPRIDEVEFTLTIRLLEDGDIMNVDVTVFLDGYHGDTSRSFAVGTVDRKGKHLLGTAQEALNVGIGACGPGKPFRAIGEATHSFIHGHPPSTRDHLAPNPRDGRPRREEVIYSICTEFTGHGIGTEFHMRPWIIHTKNEEPEVMAPGDCFTIEVRNLNCTEYIPLMSSITSRLAVNRQPIILQRSHSEETGIFLWMDGWTASTDNAARGAVFEHTVMITENGVHILTA